MGLRTVAGERMDGDVSEHRRPSTGRMAVHWEDGQPKWEIRMARDDADPPENESVNGHCTNLRTLTEKSAEGFE